MGVPGLAQTPAYDPGAAVRHLKTRSVDASRDATSARGAGTAAVADPNCKHVGFKLGFQDTGRLCLGWIVDGTAIANCYRVQIEKMRAPLAAAACTHNSHGVVGAKSLTSYAPGTPVILMVHDKMDLAYILGAVPSVLDVAYRGFHDYISQTTRKRVDDCQKKYLKLPNSGSMSDCSAWRPIDQTLASEWGAISTTGLSVSLDDFLVKLSVNEFTGVFGFYHDSMLRVAGYNMQTWTGGHERDAYVDQGEYNDYQGYSPYPWEAAGLLDTGVPNVIVYDPLTYLQSKGKPYYAHFENKHEYAQPYHRTQQFFGYLGQGSRSVVQAPPESVERWMYKPGEATPPGTVFDSQIQAENTNPPQATSGEDKLKDYPIEGKPPIGLHEDNVGLDGRRFIASAKGIILAKRMLLPMPVRLKRPEAGDGDDALSTGDNKYRAAGKEGMGDGPEHKITGDVEANDTHKNMQRASGVLDLHAYLFNYAGLHPFYWHTKDWKTYEQKDLKYAECNHRVPDFSELTGSMYLKEPTPVPIKIDHRYGTQNFYETTAGISILEDGSIVLSDGYGAEIKMSGGCLILSAPGDVWMKSGRHTQSWAGGDIIERANGSVDISTTRKNIRIKSEKNVLILAGNNANSSEKDGGVLIESRADAIYYDFEKAGDQARFGGVALRAPNSNVVGLAHQIYLRSGGGNNDFKPGNITIDAGKGEKDLVTKSNRIFNYVGESGEICNFFSIADAGKPQVAQYFSKDYVLLCGDFAVEKNIIAGGGTLCRDFLLCDGPIVGDSVAYPCESDCSKSIQKAIDKVVEYIKKKLPKMARDFHNDYLSKLWYDAQRAGNDRVMNIMEFSWRTDDDYNIPNFMLYEDRWQQMARLTNKIPSRWTETSVKSKVAEGGETYPFPGRKWLIDRPAYRTQDFNLVEVKGGNLVDKERGENGNLADEYKQPKFAQASAPEIINGQYPIVSNP